MKKIFLLHFVIYFLNISAQTDTSEILKNKALSQLEQAIKPWLITDFAQTGMNLNSIVKTSPFLQYPVESATLGSYLSGFEKETNATIIVRAYIEAPFFNPWVWIFKTSQQVRKTAEILTAKSAFAVLDIVLTPVSINKYTVSTYNIDIRDSIRSPEFRQIFAETDWQRMRDTMQFLFGKTIKNIDTTKFNTAIRRGLEALKGPAEESDPHYSVSFKKGSCPGYDEYQFSTLRKYYGTAVDGLPVSWLSADATQTCLLEAHFAVGNPQFAQAFPLSVDAAGLNSGPPLLQDTLLKQQILSGGIMQELHVEAVYASNNRFNKNKKVAGQVSIAAYEPKEKKLIVVVPYELELSAVEIQSYLNEVYGQAIIKWNVETKSFKYDFRPAISTEKAFASNYSKDMNTVVKKFKNENTVESKTFYIFVVPDFDDGAAGYMPFKGQFGFVKQDENILFTIAHELGHGAFNLRHTFSETNFVASQGQTQNLMDYTQNHTTGLFKYQWDLIHNPENILLTFLEEDEETELKSTTIVRDIVEQLKTAYSAHKKIKLGTRSGIVYGENMAFGNKNYTSVALNFGSYVNDSIDVRKMDKDEHVLAGETYYDIWLSTASYGKYMLVTLKTQRDRDSLFRYIQTAPAKVLQEQKIEAALHTMEAYLGNTYKQEHGNLRTDETAEATAKMDCSEFVSRYLKEACGLDNVPALNTTAILDLKAKPENNMIKFVTGSKDTAFRKILPGDIFLWRRASEGHTGIIVEYDARTDMVTVMEAIAKYGAAEERFSKTLPDYCKGCVRKSCYRRSGKSLALHEGWQGYFRPVVN